jgi:hypothetical protein
MTIRSDAIAKHKVATWIAGPLLIFSQQTWYNQALHMHKRAPILHTFFHSKISAIRHTEEPEQLYDQN